MSRPEIDLHKVGKKGMILWEKPRYFNFGRTPFFHWEDHIRHPENILSHSEDTSVFEMAHFIPFLKYI
jgi:hypothetical protein